MEVPVEPAGPDPSPREAAGPTIPPGLTRARGKTLRAPVLLALLAEELPDATIALDFRNRWELLVATILSAQSTDVKVNQVTPALFAAFDGPEAVAAASQEQIEALISSLGLYRQKARNIRAAAALLLEHHGGEVPDSMAALTALPGVARKTANVVLSNGYGRHDGVVVDTHVARLARRLRLSREQDAVRIERDLMRLFPRQRWLEVSDLLIHHGRRTCTARAPRCGDCVIEPLCPSSQEAGLTDKR